MEAINKSHWVADTNSVSLSMPISKVDSVNRLVSGWATLDNIDTSEDVVTRDASIAAFERFRGNIREMHEPIAAGRLVDFKEDSFFSPEENKFYSGIFVTVYVSLGAENTWQKVLDGTLSGFSIGGNITDQETQYVPDLQKSVRFIKGYNLIELSLVDNPANQLANVFSIVKSQEGGTLIKGMVAETHLINVFWCSKDEVAKNSSNESEVCFNCGDAMEQIGWFEKGEDEAVKTASAVADFLRMKEDNNSFKKSESADSEGGVQDMAEKETVATETDVVTSDDVANVEEVSGDEANTEVDAATEENNVDGEETAKVEEVRGDPDFEKLFNNFQTEVKESIHKTVEAFDEKVATATEAFDKKTTEFEKSIEDLSNKLEAIRGEREDVSKRLDALEKASAIKKSGEVETAEPVKKSQKGGLWSGTFLD